MADVFDLDYYILRVTRQPPAPDNDFYDRPGSYAKTLFNPRREHLSNDVPCTLNTYVRAVVPGLVVFSGTYGELGKLVVVKDRFGRTWGSAHLNSISGGAAKGRRVSPYTLIGRAGQTGNATGVHVHHFGCEDDNWLANGYGTSPFFNTYPYLRRAWENERARGQWAA